MLPKAFEYLKQMASHKQLTDKHSSEIREIQTDMKALAGGLQDVRSELKELKSMILVLHKDIEHFKETVKSENENNSLRLEIRLMKFESQLALSPAKEITEDDSLE